VILADADHFKRINDTYGHLAGDRVLREVAGRMMALLRPYDTVGRYGGEEFLIVLPRADAGRAWEIAERMRTRLAEQPFQVGEVRLHIEASVGVAQLRAPGETAQELIRRADAALYTAKARGRNRVEVAS
jgi:diguanylate cyclase (GGDEF)-like protein